MSTTIPAKTTVGADLYAEVQQFYARQVHLLDSVQAEPFAATFTADAVFEHSPDTPAVHGRDDIAEEVRTYQKRRFGDNPVQRRHWFNMLDVSEQPDGTLHTRYYALIVLVRPDEPQPVIAPSCTVRDVLVREDGELRARSRRVSQDHRSF